MSKNSFEFVENIVDQLSSLKAITSGNFFGGQGISSNSVQFAMIMGDSLFFVVDNTTRENYTSMGTSCFWYMKKTGKVNVRKYHQVPEDILRDKKQLIKWAKESITIATKLRKK